MGKTEEKFPLAGDGTDLEAIEGRLLACEGEGSTARGAIGFKDLHFTRFIGHDEVLAAV